MGSGGVTIYRSVGVESTPPRQLHRPSLQDPLSVDDYAALARAGRALVPARKADRVAGASGWFLLAMGFSGLPFSLGSGVGAALCVSLVVIGIRELLLRRELRALVPAAFGRLARNQLALGACLAGYGLIKLLGPAPEAGSLGKGELAGAPEVEALATGLVSMVHYGVYGGLIAGAFIFQGLHAAYYARAGKRLRLAHSHSPPWVMRVHATTWSGRVPEALPLTETAQTAPPGSGRAAAA